MGNFVDKILDLWEDHKKACIAGIAVFVLIVILIVIKSVNNARGAREMAEAEQARIEQEALEEQQRLEEEEAARLAEEEANKKVYKETGYSDSLSYRAQTDGRVTYQEPDDEQEEEVQVEVPKASFNIEVHIFDRTDVPVTNVDGSSCKDYLDKVSLADFGTMWGSDLTTEDFSSTTKYLVGVKQDKNNYEHGDLMSVGWVYDNFDKMNDNDAIKFTNLHVIGSLSSTHTAVLCSYDWYSVFGLKDTLVVFEDMSGTLKPEDFKDGAIFYATVFKHNCKVLENVNGQRVLCVEYNVFN